MRSAVPEMICPYCVILAGLDPSYALLPQQAPPEERCFAVPVSDYSGHCFALHPRLAGLADERLAQMAREEYRSRLAAARPHGVCGRSPRCEERAQDRRVESCKRAAGRGRRLP